MLPNECDKDKEIILLDSDSDSVSIYETLDCDSSFVKTENDKSQISAFVYFKELYAESRSDEEANNSSAASVDTEPKAPRTKSSGRKLKRKARGRIDEISRPKRATRKSSANAKKPEIEVYKKESLLRQHMLAMHGSDKTPWRCVSCRTSFCTRVDTLAHIKLNPNCDQQQQLLSCYLCADIRGGVSSFHCDICKWTFPTPDMLLTHWRTHGVAAAVFSCRFCHRQFEKQFLRDEHIKCYHRNEKQPCPICGYQSVNVEAHIDQSHFSEASHCRYCDRSFKHGFTRDRHERKRHTGESILTCDLCGYGAPDHYYMKQHMRKHDEAIDKDGNYLPVPIPDMTKVAVQAKDRFRASGCGPDLPFEEGVDCECCDPEDELSRKRENVEKNSRFCDTDDLRFFIAARR